VTAPAPAPAQDGVAAPAPAPAPAPAQDGVAAQVEGHQKRGHCFAKLTNRMTLLKTDRECQRAMSKMPVCENSTRNVPKL
jgi:hypothetical protein